MRKVSKYFFDYFHHGTVIINLDNLNMQKNICRAAQGRGLLPERRKEAKGVRRKDEREGGEEEQEGGVKDA